VLEPMWAINWARQLLGEYFRASLIGGGAYVGYQLGRTTSRWVYLKAAVIWGEAYVGYKLGNATSK
jgi:hypothetical protein